MKDLNITQLIQQHGVDKLRFEVALRPVRRFIFNYTSSNDPEVKVLCKIVEERYKLKDNYKIELRAENQTFGKQAFYLTDLNSLINHGSIRVFIEL